MVQYKDGNHSRDHTYYGNGCPNDWDSSNPTTYGGSTVACTTRTEQTIDGENQKNGTYYSLVASTSGAASTIAEGNSPDTFCPLGWQMPYNSTGGDYYNKSRSWRYLFERYGNGSLPSGTIAMSYPLSINRAGEYYTGVGTLLRQGSVGIYWSESIADLNSGRSLFITTSGVIPAVKEGKYVAIPFRCVICMTSRKGKMPTKLNLLYRN